MKKLFTGFLVVFMVLPAIAAVPATGRGRASVSNQHDGRAAVSKKYINNIAATNSANSSDDNTSGDAEGQSPAPDVKPDVTPDVVPEKTKDMREREKAACIQNNIGVGATFVWASKYSNSSDYSSMIEDVEFPENNVCFVKVAMKSNDSRIDVSDIPTKYFLMGDTITCGQWTNEENLKSRILDAKKKGRTWATVGGAVGGAGIGVGAMELFGNKLIGGKVEGQAALSGTELLCSQMKVLKQEKSSKYNDIVDALKDLKKYCEETPWTTENPVPSACNPSVAEIDSMQGFDYKALLGC